MSRLFKKKKHSFQSEEMGLNITALADVMVIILVFMLKSFTSGAMQVTPAPGITLPMAEAQEPNFDALKIEIAENAILVGDKPVADLSTFQFDRKDLQGNGTSKALSQALDRERQRQILIAKSNSEVKVDPKVYIVADQRAPYATVKTVLASAAINGYTDFKLAVVQPR